MVRHRPVPVAAILLSTMFLAGCAGPLGMAFTIASLATTAATGKGISEQALSEITGMDCNVMEGIFNKKRDLCEEPGSLATRDDFKGFFADDEAPDAAVDVVSVTASPTGADRAPTRIRVMAPIVTSSDRENAGLVRALPPVVEKPPPVTRHGKRLPAAPVLVRADGRLVYTMAPVAHAPVAHAAKQRRSAPKPRRAVPRPPPVTQPDSAASAAMY